MTSTLTTAGTVALSAHLHQLLQEAAAPTGELLALRELAQASQLYRLCVESLLSAEGDWRRFSATHDADDQGHDVHHQRLQTARQNYAEARRQLLEAEAALNRAPGPIELGTH